MTKLSDKYYLWQTHYYRTKRGPKTSLCPIHSFLPNNLWFSYCFIAFLFQEAHIIITIWRIQQCFLSLGKLPLRFLLAYNLILLISPALYSTDKFKMHLHIPLHKDVLTDLKFFILWIKFLWDRGTDDTYRRCNNRDSNTKSYTYKAYGISFEIISDPV